MRILVAIPHFFRPMPSAGSHRSHRPESREERRQALTMALAALDHLFGPASYGLDHFNRLLWPAAPSAPHAVDIVICTTGRDHLVDELPASPRLFSHHQTEAEPPLLGFECHKVLREGRGRYDYYGYLEDDIVLADPLLFRKRRVFDRAFGPEALLQPNRYELSGTGPVRKLYVDYNLYPGTTAAHQNIARHPRLHLPFLDETIVLERTSYPSAGCFFLDAAQLERWVEGPFFLDGDTSYLGPLDSAATLSVMKTFRIYKPVLDQASFLEVFHASPRWIAGIDRILPIAPGRLPFAPHLPSRAAPGTPAPVEPVEQGQPGETASRPGSPPGSPPQTPPGTSADSIVGSAG